MANKRTKKKKDTRQINETHGILTGKEILELKLISSPDDDYADKCIKAASCDLRLGDEVFICGQGTPAFRDLKDGEPVTIQPLGRIIFKTRERICLQDDIVGRLDLMIRHGLAGLILQVGTQIEPRYEGPIFGLLINTHGEDKTLLAGSRLLTVEFSRINKKPSQYLQKDSVDKLREFLESQNVSLDDAAKLSVVDKIREEMNNCRTDHGLMIKGKDRITADSSRKWTKREVITAIIIAIILFLAAIFSQEIRGLIGLEAKSVDSKENEATQFKERKKELNSTLDRPIEKEHLANDSNSLLNEDTKIEKPEDFNNN